MRELLIALPDPVRQALAPASEAGVLRALDLALTELLYRHAPDSPEAALVLAAWCSQQHGQGHVCLSLADACAEPALLLPERLRHQDMLLDWWRGQQADRLSDTLGDCALVDTRGDPEGSTPLVLDNGRLYLRRTWRDELEVSDRIRARLQQPSVSPAELSGRLDALFPTSDSIDWQRAACAMASRSALTLITGGPGTGKTTTVVRLLALLQGDALEHGRALRIRLAAPTGKAAARLTASIGGAIDALPVDDSLRAHIPRDVVTLHKLLGRRPNSRRFRHDADNPLHADLVIVDEASMIDLDMMASLLRALTPQTRLVLIGDKDQLASVEAGSVMGDLCLGAAQPGYHNDTADWLASEAGINVSAFAGPGSALAQHTTMLRTSHRFTADSGIGALASAVNAGDSGAGEQLWQAGHGDLDSISSHGTALAERARDGYRHYLDTLRQQRPASEAGVGSWARDVLAALPHFQLLCAVRDGAAGLNQLNDRVAAALQEAGLIERREGWYEGRPVMVTRNDYQSGLMNGDMGVTLSVPQADGSTRLRVAFELPDGSLRLVLPSRLDQVETTYAMTVHKSQGSEFDHVALVLPDDSAAVVTRELLYTAITRARSTFTLAARDRRSWQAALARPTRRTSGLAARLHDS